MRVLIDASNVTAAGPCNLVANLLTALMRSISGWSVDLLLPAIPDFASLPLGTQTKAVYWRIARGRTNDLLRIKRLYWDLPQISRELKPDVALTLGDLGGVQLRCPHVIFLHNAYYLYSRAEVGSHAWSLAKQCYMIRHLAWSLRSASCVIVQTPVMAERLHRRFSFPPERIVQIAQPVPQQVLDGLGGQARCAPIENSAKPIRLLFLAAQYPHKNHAILPSVADELRRRGMSSTVHIFTTLDNAHGGRRSLKNALERHSDIITNLGRLSIDRVASALRASSALFLPTLAESYGLIYLEAMACGVPILTSDRDFARWMCRDLALYFDPLDPASIVGAIETLVRSVPSDYAQRAKQRLRSFPRDWDEVAQSFITVLCRAAKASG